MPTPIQLGGAGLDLSPRLYHSQTVAASPTDNTETVICTLTITEDVALAKGVVLWGFGATTQGASGTGVTLKLRRTGTSGTTVKSTGIIPLAAGVLGAFNISGVDTGITPLNQVYVLTALHTAAAAASTYSAVSLVAIVI
jgi:hypothetical protein